MAAALILALSWWVLLKKPENITEQMAVQYIEQNLMTLPVKTDDTQDSLELGKGFYNERKYPEALSIFEKLLDKESQALEFTGLTILQMNKFEEAIRYFEILSQNTELITNKGKFYTALVYFKQRNTQKGKLVLKKVIEQNLAGKKDAEVFLK
jgi:tetratricopeptide (TPR) repeat protein